MTRNSEVMMDHATDKLTDSAKMLACIVGLANLPPDTCDRFHFIRVERRLRTLPPHVIFEHVETRNWLRVFGSETARQATLALHQALYG